jgi:predicted Zn-dependent protease
VRTLLTLLFVCFFVHSAHGEGQAQKSSRNSANNALSNMENTFISMDDELTPQDAYYLGRAVAANILAVYRPYTRNPELTAYLNRICRTIAINSPQPEMFNGYHVIILDSAEFNAFASPGGHILITRGLVEAAASEDMLAAVIAHEFAHILLMHGISMIADMRLNDELTATATRAGEIASRESQEAARAVLFRNSVTKLADVMMKTGYSQAQEFEADTAAITLLAASGYNPGALMEMLKVLQTAQSSQKGGFGVTHPSPADRITNADRMTGRYRIQDTGSSRTPRFRRALAK